jgi:hypothetical protein
MNRDQILWGSLVLALLPDATALRAGPLHNDQSITVTAANAASRRQELISYIWGTDGFPPSSTLPVRTHLSGPPSDLTPAGTTLENLATVDKLTITMEGAVGGPAETDIAYHLVPKRKNNRLVIMNPGHACAYTEQLPADPTTDGGFGDLRTLNALLREGYSVLATYMPHMIPGACANAGTATDHKAMLGQSVRTGSPLKWFLEPIAVSLNYLRTRSTADGFPQYQEYDFVGLSGGGWTATVYAAIDPSIKVSIPVSGSIPLYLRSGGSIGDAEQTVDSFYSIAGYPDLYVLGAYGADRRQIQVLNRGDNCCFGEPEFDAGAHGPWQAAMRKTEHDVRIALKAMGSTAGAGFFRLEIDDSADHHEFSWHTITNTIVAELNQGRRPVGAASTSNAFARGLNGNLWQSSTSGWVDTNLAMVGAPAVIEGAIHTIDVFYRDPGNLLMHAFPNGSTWQTEALGGQLVVDPVVARFGSNPVFIAGLGYDYHLYFWSIPGTGSFTRVSDTFRGLGQTAIAASSSAVHLYSRSFDGALHHLQSNSGTAPTGWTHELVGGVVTDSPSAAQNGNTLLVYARGLNTNHFWEASRSGSGAWTWTDISAATGAPDLTGSPSVSSSGATTWLDGRAVTGDLIRFSKGTSWKFSKVSTNLSGSPVAVGAQTYARGTSGHLWRFDGSAWQSLLGLVYF